MTLSDLTPSMIDSLEAGAEMDALVAEAIGWRFVSESASFVEGFGPLPRFAHFVDSDAKEVRCFRPSSDWNDAMYAAGEVRLFDGVTMLGRTHDMTEWIIGYEQFDEEFIVEAHAETGPLAIARAILKAKVTG